MGTSFAQPEVCREIRNGRMVLKNTSPEALLAICQCQNLTDLTLKKSTILALPSQLTELTQLKSLSFTRSKLGRFPIVVLSLDSLHSLDLSFTDISYLPADIAQLKNLKHLDLQGTGVRSLPEGLGHLDLIDLRMTEMNRSDQDGILAQYPDVTIFFSSPCNCN